jgi:hypothetical protein
MDSLIIQQKMFPQVTLALKMAFVTELDVNNEGEAAVTLKATSLSVKEKKKIIFHPVMRTPPQMHEAYRSNRAGRSFSSLLPLTRPFLPTFFSDLFFLLLFFFMQEERVLSQHDEEVRHCDFIVKGPRESNGK